MGLEALDYIIIISFLIISLLIGLKYKKQAEGGLSDFFLGGRNLPWYIAGISMVATTFAADTPLAVTELVADSGISSNWLWWNFLLGGMLTTFFFARLWRKSGVLTELELIDVRYGGKEGNWLRKIKAVYLGVIINSIIIGWVNLAMIDILTVFFEIAKPDVYYYCFGLMALAVFYSSLSGLKGVAITDTIQFVVAMVGTIVLAIFVVGSEEVGGISGLTEKLPDSYFNFFPAIGSETASSSALYSIPVGAFIALAGMNWWASWYPGAEPGGGGYIAQRMMSTKTEKDSFLATLFFQVGHYCLRPWPWILVALASVALYSPQINKNYQVEDMAALYGTGFSTKEISDLEISKGITFDETQVKILSRGAQTGKEVEVLLGKDLSEEQVSQLNFALNNRTGYLMTIQQFLPVGLKGLLLVAFIAAYLSTISTQVNWGASYIVNDLVLLGRTETESTKDSIKISRWTTLGIMVIALVVTTQMNSIKGAWEIIMESGAGLGLVLILRWFWKKINIWSEISATVAPFVGYFLIRTVLTSMYSTEELEWINNNKIPFMLNVLFTTVCWLVATWLTKDKKSVNTDSFFQKIAPFRKSNGSIDKYELGITSAIWIVSVILVYAILFSSGYLILQKWNSFFITLAILVVSVLVFIPLFKKYLKFE